MQHKSSFQDGYSTLLPSHRKIKIETRILSPEEQKQEEHLTKSHTRLLTKTEMLHTTNK